MTDLFIDNVRVTVTAKNTKNNNVLSLSYGVINTDIGKRWINLINRNNELNHSLKFNYRRYFEFEEILEQFDDFKNNVDFINQNYDRQLTILTTFEDLRDNQSILNDLHEEYEIYGDRLEELLKIDYFSSPEKYPDRYQNVWPGKNHNKFVHEAFLLLNEQIHNFESIYRIKETNQPSMCSCLLDFVPAGLHEPLKPEDYFLFSAEREWGWGFLGYNTLGKNWYTSCWDKDVEVVKRQQIRTQERFAVEFYMNFSRPNTYDSNIRFHQWWTDNNFSEITDPNFKLKDFAYGYIPIAKLFGYTINNAEFINVDSIDSKIEWNQQIWSKFNIIESIRVTNI